MAVSLTVSTQYTNVTDRHGMTAKAVLMHASRGKNDNPSPNSIMTMLMRRVAEHLCSTDDVSRHRL